MARKHVHFLISCLDREVKVRADINLNESFLNFFNFLQGIMDFERKSTTKFN